MAVHGHGGIPHCILARRVLAEQDFRQHQALARGAQAGGLQLRGGGLEAGFDGLGHDSRSEEHTSELQSLMRISYAVFCLKKKKTTTDRQSINRYDTKSSGA